MCRSSGGTSRRNGWRGRSTRADCSTSAAHPRNGDFRELERLPSDGRGPSGEPLLSLKLDTAVGRLHVVRGVDSYVWEGYSEGNVYLSRERRRWTRELIATFDLAAWPDTAALADEAARAVAEAVVGTRLPLTPVAAPHPAFSFGQLYYGPDGGEDLPVRTPAELLGAVSGAAHRCGEGGRVVEAWLRAAPEGVPLPVGELAAHAAAAGMDSSAILATLRTLFLDVSLSPWTGLVDRVLALLTGLEEGGIVTPVQVIDFESWLLRLVSRHLTAYDLLLFHHRGANYPDALLLDVVLGDYLRRLERFPEQFAGPSARLRRRALRQAYLLRRRYEGHPVPDAPTSPGEHQRAFPSSVPRVPEEQILEPRRRQRRLFADAPLADRLGPAAWAALRESVADLDHPAEQQDLGAGLFLDRPFGGAKGAVEPDATPLLASVAYSRSLASDRLRQLARDLGIVADEASALPGIALDRIGAPVRQGTVSLADATRSAPDWVFRHTLSGHVAQLAEWFDLAPLGDVAWLTAGPVLLARSPTGPGLTVYDASWTARLEIVARLESGYRRRRGVELPADGLRAIDTDGRTVDLPVR
ncbi:MAG: hypothetical protein U0736_11930 [Gemmataceae bacterium]